MGIPLKQYLALLSTYLRPQWRQVVMLAVLLLTSIALQLLNPQLLRSFIDTATQKGAPETLTWLALVFIGVALLNQVLSIALTYVSESVGWSSTNALRADLAEHCLQLDMAFHKARTPGELIERVDGDVNELSNFFSQLVVHLFGNALLMVGVLALLFREDWRVGLGLSVFALGSLYLLIRIRSFATPYWNEVREQSAQFFGFVGEQLAGTEDVRSSGATGYVMRRFYTLVRAWLPITRRANLAGYTMWTTTLGLFVVGNAIAFALGAYLWGSGQITIGTVYLIFHYTEQLRQPIEQLRTQLQDLQRADASIGRIAALFGTKASITDGVGTPIPSGPLAVEFAGVSFGYDDEMRTEATGLSDGQLIEAPSLGPQHSALSPEVTTQPSVLSGISFRLAPGTVLGLLGRTGSGKTTLARLALRLYDPQEGTVRLGGTDVRDARIDELRERVGIVTQDVQLFNASVRDNLTLFDSSIADERIVAVLRDLGLGPWFDGLQHGLDSLLESGGSLSAGEAQLLAFARLFLRDPGLIIMDEASSRLDPATEQLIERAVDKLLLNRTGIIIAHRLATVHRADEIMTLDGGRVLEHGSRARLASDPGSRFAQLLRTGIEEVLA